MEWTRVDPQNREKKKLKTDVRTVERKRIRKEMEIKQRERGKFKTVAEEERGGWKGEMKKVLFF